MISNNSIFWIKFCIAQKVQVLHSRWEIGIITNMVDLMSIMHGWKVINVRPYGISSLTCASIYATWYRWSIYVSYSFMLNSNEFWKINDSFYNIFLLNLILNDTVGLIWVEDKLEKKLRKVVWGIETRIFWGFKKQKSKIIYLWLNLSNLVTFLLLKSQKKISMPHFI